MGNAPAGSGSIISAEPPSTRLQSLIKNKYSIVGIPYTKINAHLIDVASLAKDIEASDSSKYIGNKEIKFGLQVISEIVDCYLSGQLPLPSTILALEAILALVSVTSFSKKVIESAATQRLFESLKPTEIENFVGIIGITLRLFRSLHDDFHIAPLFSLLDKCGSLQKFFVFVTQSSVVNEPNMLCGAIVILELVHWALNSSHVTLIALRVRIKSIALQHRDSLFELSRHPLKKLSNVATILIIKLMSLEDKNTCVAIQVGLTILDIYIAIYLIFF
jgi:hypothetical protein